MTSISLRDFLSQSIKENAINSQDKGVLFHLESEDCQLSTDSDRLSQVMTNLLSNAIRFSKKGDTINVSAFKKDGHIQVEVSDQGQGISPYFQPKVFQKFCKEESENVKNPHGTGLGLSISKVIIERLGGTINFKSSTKGTTFFFDLPLS